MYNLEKITEEKIKSNNIEKCCIISELSLNPRMIVKYENGKEMIIEGQEEINLFIDTL